ncbi:helix-turn-helix domain-containing protein [Lysinibacillus telephonicus]|uniref:XRE family transcriptional regulator n=1 Tax=Lysinibacillus telephonicus TaxID=1714840 RepID=A0A3S0HEE5_9BACI|nr:helix-turn-helix transcriptional regulator [Lysinibacillus telephonicus]RTQ88229.1 XRE family transcriptional regulator [Lysinibacillus telephonicus]
MLQNLGSRIRTLRTNKGISLNAFAEKLDVSPGYLSNLETGKTDTIQLSLLEKLQNELYVLPLKAGTSDELESRLNHAMEQLRKLEKLNPDAAQYLLNTFERGLELLLKN